MLLTLALCASAPSLVSAQAYAFTQAQIETFDNEPPLVRDLLERASLLLQNEKDEYAEQTKQAEFDGDAAWRAASLYCEAARYGSAEATYRLGMLYTLGKGVPENRDYAANLFGAASMHGHQAAQSMLETLVINTTQSPPCVQAAVAPEKPTFNQLAYGQSPAIEAYIATLPKSKRWVVDLANNIASWHQVDSKLVLSIITAESNFRVAAQSNKSAQGLMQLIPATAERFNVKDAFTASQNIKGGVRYLRWLLSYFRGDVRLAVAAYNAGEHAVDRYKGVPPYPETKNYVKKVMHLYPIEFHSFDANITAPSPALKYMKRQPNVKKASAP